MLNFSEIVQSIKKLYKFNNDDEVAVLLETTAIALRSAKSRNRMQYEKLLKFCEKENKSADWVFLGRGKPHEPGFDQATPEEKEFLDKVLKVYRNPATKEGLESTVNTMAKVPMSESEAD